MAAYDDLLSDLAAEQQALEAVVDPLASAGLCADTPAEGWTVRDQLSHLAGFDEAALMALRDPDGFMADLERRLAVGDDPVTSYTERGRDMAPAEVVDWWRSSRSELLAAARNRDPKERIPWYGPPMSAMSFVSARIMETWAHGQDVRDAVGAPPSVSDRLRHVAHIGVGARAFSFANRGLEVPEAAVDVVLTAPSGEIWRWGPGDSSDRVEGHALDFCLLVTQRRHRDDVVLVVTGSGAEEWLAIAQAFAGAPSAGRRPGQFEI